MHSVEKYVKNVSLEFLRRIDRSNFYVDFWSKKFEYFNILIFDLKIITVFVDLNDDKSAII